MGIPDHLHRARANAPWSPESSTAFGRERPRARTVGYRGVLIFGCIVVAAFFGGFGSWAALAPLDSAAIARGTVMVEGNRKTVQHFEGGIVREVKVSEGTIVEAGDPVVILDETQPRATLGTIRSRHAHAIAREARLLAERDGLDHVVFPRVLSDAGLDNPAMAAVVESQRSIFESNRQRNESQKALMAKRIDQYLEEIIGLEGEIDAADVEAETIREELADAEFLVEKGLGRKPHLLALRRQEAEIAGRRARNVALIARARQSIAEAELRISDLETTRLNETIRELRDVQSEISDLEERLHAAEDILSRTVVRAPVRGQVVNLRIFTVGGVVQPGEPLMDIVPLADEREIVARGDPIDINVVRADLPARVRLSSYDMRTTPTLEGVVETVSGDRLIDERTGVAYYEARVRVLEEAMARLDDDVRLYPGMPVEVMIVTGERTTLDYLLKPITGTLYRGLKEN